MNQDLRLVQEFSYPFATERMRDVYCHPGFCEAGDCVNIAVAFYARPDNSAIKLCAKHQPPKNAQ